MPEEKILEWFFSFPNSMIGLSELADKIKISKTTANRKIKLLEKRKLLNIEIIGKSWRISPNIDNKQFFNLKLSYNLKKIYESKIIDEINREVPNSRAVILFGSYRKGDDTEKSDVDIAVEVLSNEDLKIKTLKKINIGLRKNIPINLHIFSKKRIDLNLFSNIANGIVLDGFLEVKA